MRNVSGWSKWTAMLFIAAGVLAFALAPDGAWGKDVDALRIGIGIDADTLNPLEVTTAIPGNIMELIYDKPLLSAPGGKFLPNMVTEWSVSEDGKTWTLKLRKGIKFTDGVPFNAQTLKRELELIQDPNVRVPLRFIFSSFERLTVVDDYTVQYHLKAPFALFEGVLSIMLPISQQATQPYDGARLSGNPVGAGPYRLTEWVRGERIVLERNEGYWGKRPTVGKLVFQIVPETATRIAMLRAGQLDIACSPTPADIPALEADPNIQVFRPLSTRMIFMGMNTQKGFTKDKRVRQAFNYAVDKKAITDKLMFGVAKPLDAPLPPSVFGYTPMEMQYGYDPEKAKALLKEASFPQDAVIKMITPTGRYTYDKQIAEAIQAYLKDVGVKTELRTYDWPTYIGMMTKPLEQTEVELYLIGWGWPIYDADPYLLVYFSSFVHPPKGLGATFYTNPEFDKAVGAARGTVDPVKRKELYKRAATKLWEDAAAIWLHVEPYSIAYQAKYKGLEVQPNERMYPTYVTTAD
jgi:ABC-type transport system substrate-binding protein